MYEVTKNFSLQAGDINISSYGLKYLGTVAFFIRYKQYTLHINSSERMSIPYRGIGIFDNLYR